MIRLVIAGVLIIMGVCTLVVAAVGVFRFSHMLNMIHAAAKCDTLGAVLVILGLMVLSGWGVFSLKLGLAAVFLWLGGAAVRHLTARAEVKTNPELESLCDYVDMTKGETLNDCD